MILIFISIEKIKKIKELYKLHFLIKSCISYIRKNLLIKKSEHIPEFSAARERAKRVAQKGGAKGKIE